MEGQGVAGHAYSHVTDDLADAGEAQRRNGDDTLVMPAIGGDADTPADSTPSAPDPAESTPPEPADSTSSDPVGSALPAASEPAASEPAAPGAHWSAESPRPDHGDSAVPVTAPWSADSTPPDPAGDVLSGAPGSIESPPPAASESEAVEPREVPDAPQPHETPQPPQSAEPSEPHEAAEPPAPQEGAQPHARVDARLLEAALLNLRKRIAAIPLVFEIAGSADVKAERTKLLGQIDDYLLPRVRRSAAPVLVALVGSTGSGKSTLVNSIVGAKVSVTGVRRPTTNSPVLACHPDDIEWFAENNFMPTLPRVRQEGLARPGRDGLLVLAASEGMPKGIALLDTPDIDSVVQAHHEFAYQFLDAADLWLFMTSASRYADGPVWEILQYARDRRASLAVVLSRVPQPHRTELVEHFNAMLDANGVAVENRFVIAETPLINDMLPREAYQPVRDWLAETAERTDRRVAVLTQTMSGVLDTFRSRVPAVAAHVEAQVVLREQLRRAAETAYQRAFADIGVGMKDGTLLSGEVMARWQDCVAGGDLQPRRGRKSARGVARSRRARRGPPRTTALNTALRSAIESFTSSVADRAAEQADTTWRADPAGAVLLADAAAERARGERAKQVFESAFGPNATSGPPRDGDTPDAALAAAFSRSSPDLPLRAARAIGAWQDHLTRMVEAEDLRPAAKRISFDGEALSLVVLVALLGEEASGGQPKAARIYSEPRQLLTSAFGTLKLANIVARARADLLERIRLLLDEEMVRFAEVIEAAGSCDDVAAIRLYQAEYSLEAVR
jgi:energy-coupling factor transporter ATP-binding protein EcfA2